MSAVVLVDDEPTLLGILGRVLEDAGHEVRRATTQDAAMRLFARATPDVVVCSTLPMIWAIRAVKALASVTIVLLVDPENRVTPLEPDVHVLAKPVVLAELLRLVRGAA